MHTKFGDFFFAVPEISLRALKLTLTTPLLGVVCHL